MGFGSWWLDLGWCRVVLCLTLLCSQTCKIFAFALMAQRPCDEATEYPAETRSVTGLKDRSYCNGQKGTVGGVDEGV